MISANELRNLQFSAAENGYNAEEVIEAMDMAAETIDAYVAENKELYRKLEMLASKIEEYRAEEDSIKTALITAQKMADKIEKSAQDEADVLRTQSEEAAKDCVEKATAEADKLVSEAREYSANLVKEKSAEAQNIVLNAEQKANDAINSSKIVAQNILDQAKEISEDLISKSKEEKEAYETLTAALKENAKGFIEKLRALYTEQLSLLGGADLETPQAEEQETVDSIQEEVDSLVSEMEDMENAIPDEVTVTAGIPAVEEEEEAAPVAQEEDAFEVIDDESEDDDADDEDEDEDDGVTADPMKAVEAFSQDAITPLDENEIYLPEIDEEPEMETAEEKSLFDETDTQLPFESYFNVSKEDAHLDPTQTISLVPPEDDEEKESPKFKGFFGKKK